jgi:hypothetical protein
MDTLKSPRRPLPWRKYAAFLGATAVLLLVFWFYTRPAFLVLLADQIWACF